MKRAQQKLALTGSVRANEVTFRQALNAVVKKAKARERDRRNNR